MELKRQFDQLKSVAESTTSHGKLLKIDTSVLGQDVIVEFDFYTGDAHGMNMIANATEAACRWIRSQFDVGTTRAARYAQYCTTLLDISIASARTICARCQRCVRGQEHAAASSPVRQLRG